ncbi:TBC1 domain family member 7 isoform X3 [Bombus flavifrons]|uniref:TBC1 domain family member 7 isoform X3 n=1 Tax=Bombus flavifrons TaxID=103934 RepID=UPI0037046272
MADERNFRSSYYEKVGFRSVEEKRSLEILLKERPLDKAKLKQFCLRFTVPTKYRNFLWKVLLDVIPIYIDSHKFIISQRKAEFQDLQKALKVTKILDDYTKPHLMLLTMWLLRTRRAKLDMNTQLEVPLHRAMNRLAETLWHIVDIDSYEEKIWDKIAVGAYRTLIFVTVVILTTLRRLLLRCENIDGILDTIANITEETSEVIVNKAIESWQQSGSTLTTIS